MYRGVSAETRREDRRRRLMHAAFELMGTPGETATVLGICEQAKVGPRFFYEIFENLDALAVAVLDEIVDSAVRTTLEALAAAGDDPSAQVRTVVETIVREFTDDPRRARIVFIEAYGSEPMMKRRFEAVHSLAGIMKAVGPTVMKLPNQADEFVEATSLILTGGIAELVIAWVNGRIDMSRDDLVDTCTEVLITNAQTAQVVAERIAQARALRALASETHPSR